MTRISGKAPRKLAPVPSQDADPRQTSKGAGFQGADGRMAMGTTNHGKCENPTTVTLTRTGRNSYHLSATTWFIPFKSKKKAVEFASRKGWAVEHHKCKGCCVPR